MAAPALAAAARAVLPALGRAAGRAAVSSAASKMANNNDDENSEGSTVSEPSGGSSLFQSIALNNCFYDEMGSCRS